jgi:tRNA A37 threonylcarbamoyladenosine synthetase subunit TsaC/SUA5/YrdC
MIILTKREKIDRIVKIAAEFVKEGKIIVYPTETCYGLVCDATNEEEKKSNCQ